ncbi:hypothetical protein GGS23DRAFT_497818 [Durotheca rogersii]|uniref:uncharacterized protein n=1 Tax=Durotheca rogersii TaxID=419775 RepID=UPI00221FAB27|nr:uncharacterized protein GGS23DRAFT_497818 [Durotheca rogersii]KAI5864402.1 hypothetical protein GGS23DRAFT_497818 [Durotheca rogersii]
MMGCHTKPGCAATCCRGRKDESGPVSSKFCKKHTCDHFYFPIPMKAPRCEFQKDPKDSVCPHHVICTVQGCECPRLQYRDPDNPVFRRYKFCYDHKCALRECPEKRRPDGINQNQFMTYCDNHNCIAEGCHSMVQAGRSCCERHTCGRPGCMAITVNQGRFCRTHNVCEWPDCHQPKTDPHNLCRIHTQCSTAGCTVLKQIGSMHCANHTCFLRGCNNSTGAFRLCTSHRCQFASCNEHRRTAPGALHCPSHSCRSRGCRNGVEEETPYCEAHACEAPGCRLEAKLEWEHKCLDHFKRRYESVGEARLIDEVRELRQVLGERMAVIQDQEECIRRQDAMIRRFGCCN